MVLDLIHLGELGKMMEAMTEDGLDEPRGRGSVEFIDSSILSTILPFDPDCDISAVLEEGNLTDIKQRQRLFFGTSLGAVMRSSLTHS